MSDDVITQLPSDAAERAKRLHRAKKKAEAKKREPTGDWQDQLLYTMEGRLKRCSANLIQILLHDDAWSGVLARDEFRGVDIALRKPPPWDPDYKPREKHEPGCPWTDADDGRATVWFARQWELEVTPGTVAEAVRTVAAQHAFHPVRDWFAKLRWDGTHRLDRWLTTYAGAADNEYAQAVGRWWLISAVARVCQPGCKADHLPTFEGKQGLGKSKLLRLLAGDDWFTDELMDLGSKDAAMQLQGRLIVELSELDALTRAEVSRVKAFISRTTDKYRPPYGRRVVEVPRQCVFAGSTNQTLYLKDDTGARRFWPVRCGAIDLPSLERDRDQLWAEAVAEYQEGKPWWPTTAAESKELEREQEARRQVDPWEDPIGLYAEGHLPDATITTSDVLTDCLGKCRGNWTRADEMRVASILKLLGWEQSRLYQGTRRLRAWKRAEP